MTSTGPTERCARCGTELTGAEAGCPRCFSAMLFGDEPSTVFDGAATPAGAAPSDSRLGSYQLLEEIARGGMGIVYRARQVGLDRLVAVKVLRDGATARPEEVKRFRAEAAAAARLDHPNIVAIHEVGEHEGRPFFAMDLIEGATLARLTREGPLPAQQAADLVATVAEAIQHAHEQGVLHRDLKPSNVIVDPAGRPHVTDFGLARWLDSDSNLTVTGQVLGTPGYMPPEQASGHGTVGPAADLYSLGALLYHLLTGRAPFVGGTPAETLRQVLEQEPVSPHLLNPAVPRDLTSVCLKCLAKRPADRYGSAADLAADLRRFLRGEPTRARPASPSERLLRWCRRKPALATVSALAVTAALVGVSGVVWQWRRAEAQRALAVRNEQSALQQAYAADMASVQQTLHEHHLERARALLRSHEPKAGEPDLRGWEWWYYAAQCASDEAFLLTNSTTVIKVAASKLHGGLIVGFGDGQIALCGFSPEKAPVSLCQDTNRIVALSTDAEGRFLASQAWPEGPAQIWDLSDLSKVRHIRTLGSDWVNGPYALSARDRLIAQAAKRRPDFPRLGAEGGDEGLTGIWNWETGERVQLLLESGDIAAFSADGLHLATGSWNGSVKIWETKRWQLIHTLEPAGWVMHVEFSPDGKLLATSNWRGEISLWDTGSGRRIGAWRGHRSWAMGLAFSPDGRHLASASADRTIGLWDVATFQEIKRFRGHEGSAESVAYSPDGRWLASVARPWTADTGVRVWDASARSPAPILLSIYSPVAFAPDHRTAATANSRGQVDLYNLETGSIEETIPCEPNPLAFFADGQELITASVPTVLPMEPNPIAGLKRWKRGAREPAKVVEFSPSNLVVNCARLSPDATRLVTGDKDGRVILWDAQTGRIVKEVATGIHVLHAEFSPDGRTVVIGGVFEREAITLWDLRTGQIRRLLGRGASIAFSPDGNIVATGDSATIRLWNTATGEPLGTLRGHREQVFRLSFSKDGRTLASAAEDIRLWNLPTLREVGSLPFDTSTVYVAFSPDGRRLIGGAVGHARVWTAADPNNGSFLSRALGDRAKD